MKIETNREPTPVFTPININLVVESKEELDILIGIINVSAQDVVKHNKKLVDSIEDIMKIQTRLYHNMIPYRENV